MLHKQYLKGYFAMKITIQKVLATMMLTCAVLTGCTTVLEYPEEHGCANLKPSICSKIDQQNMIEHLIVGGTLQDAINVFGCTPAGVYSDPTNCYSWAHWYWTREVHTIESGVFDTNHSYTYSGKMAWCKFKNGKLVGITLPTLTWGDQEPSIENSWFHQKHIRPLLQKNFDAWQNKQWYFNDEAKCYVYDRAGRTVDHWEGINVHWKPDPVPYGHYRVWATNAQGSPTYCDIPNGQVYDGYYNDAFHYHDPDTEMYVNAIIGGLQNAALNIGNQSQAYRHSPAMVQTVPNKSGQRQNRTTSTASSVSKPIVGTGLAERTCYACKTTYVGTHCPVCSAVKFAH